MFTKPRTLLIGLALILLASGCAVLEPQPGPKTNFAPQSKVFYERYDKVWRAVQLVMAQYPIKINNVDAGLLETQPIKARQFWVPPHPYEKHSYSHTYILKLRALKGRTGNRSAVRVSLLKQKSRSRHFAEDEKIPSDGLEEQRLLYRIGREIEIEQAIERANDRGL